MQKFKIIMKGVVFGLATLATACATTSKDARDPYEGWNRGVQNFNDNLDDYVMKPVAKGYQWITPSFVDRGITNFFSNIDDIGVTVNDLLQGKLMQSGQDGARFLVNTTAGVAGFVDVASMIDLQKHDEDFDQTLGYWGLPSGPYLVLPLFGPSSPRGVGGLIGDAAMNPISYVGLGVSSGVSTAISGGLFATNAIDARADNLSAEKIATEAAVDRYDFFKNAYLQQREYLVHDGKIPEDKKHEEYNFNIDEELDKELAPPVRPY
ncbi:VacJ family lipoprotein [Methylomicrobium sp. Wu6]|uniref:MlaA family lipoprotein n=1 Tax=Methylomicrobium sp. Wu6 TaxID=3107928 RepID=UPI002DD669BB|nr:VacJ family lipoprotein [Methylomicrobium sp. Wu6]MEC4749531.1 VacJ family lipoprotein [Methylomicrobium sp. Wu6]